MQNERSDLEREIAAMPLRKTSSEFDRRVLESIGQTSYACGQLQWTPSSRSPQNRLAGMIGYVVAATVLVAFSYSMGFRAGISAEKKSLAHNNKTSIGTLGPNPSTTIPEELHQEPSFAFQEFLTSKQDFETIWGSKETLAQFETKIVYPSENKEGI